MRACGNAKRLSADMMSTKISGAGPNVEECIVSKLTNLSAVSYGDPQITTLDGHVYSFNGRGEYIFMRIKNRYVYYTLYEPPRDKTNTVTRAQ